MNVKNAIFMNRITKRFYASLSQCFEIYTLCPKKRPPFYFSNNSVKN